MPVQQFEKETIEKDKIPQVLYGVALTEGQIKKAMEGENIYLENLNINGKVTDAKIKFYTDPEDQQVKFKLLEKKQELTIPDKVDTYQLTDKDKKDLMEEKVVAIKLKTGSLLFVQLDKELNRVTVKTEKDIKVPDEIGGYKLTDQDKVLFANKEKLPLRIFYNEKTDTHFLCNIRLTEDGKGIEFDNYKEVPKHQVKDLTNKYNTQDKAIENASGITSRIIAESTEEKTTEKKIAKKDKEMLFSEFVRDRNYQGLEALSRAGFKASEDLINKTTKENNYTQEEKNLLQSTMKIEKAKKTVKHNNEISM